MGFHHELCAATAASADDLMRVPFVRDAMSGDISREAYLAFLTQAYHHVKHTVPLLMSTGARLPARHEWLRPAIAEYIEEEIGHEAWILDDIRQAGGNAAAVRNGSPDLPCELMVAYAYDVVDRRNPIAFFGMVHVLEGTSVKAATRAANALQARLGLPKRAFTYLLTHGDLDQDHVKFFERLMDRVENPADQAAIIHSAHVFYRLYADIFRALASPQEVVSCC